MYIKFSFAYAYMNILKFHKFITWTKYIQTEKTTCINGPT